MSDTDPQQAAGEKTRDRLILESGVAFMIAAAATMLCVQRGWFDNVCMALHDEERYQLDEYVGGSAVFLLVILVMFVRREWQLRAQLKLAVGRERASYEAARHDHLTGIPNRLALVERMRNFSGERLVFLLIDLDGFKPINDEHGHEAGDAVLKAVAKRLRAITAQREAGFVARLGGDEYGVLLGVASDSEVLTTVKQISNDLRQPIQLVTGVVRVGASIGSAVAAAGQIHPDGLFRAADAAMYRLKNAKRPTGAPDDTLRAETCLGRESETTGIGIRLRPVEMTVAGD